LNNDEGIAVMAIDDSWEHSTPSGTEIHSNNIVGNVDYGVKSGVWGSDTGGVLAEEVDATNNWWGTTSGPLHATNLTGTGNSVSDNVTFRPWCSDDSYSSESILPIVANVVTDPDPAKAGEVTITVEFSESMDIEASPVVQVMDIIGSPTVIKSSYLDSIWTGTFNLEDNDEEKSAKIAVSGAQDLSGNIMADNDNAGTFTVDTIEPVFTINEDTDDGPVQTDTINITITEDYGIDISKYGFSGDETCDVNDDYDNDFSSDLDFTIAGDRTDYLCVIATDNAGNIGYQLVGQLNTDNTAPILTQVIPVTTPTNDSTPDYTFNTSEAGTIDYEDCISADIVADVGNNTITFDELNDNVYSDCTITVTDAAENASEALDVTEFMVDTTAPEIDDLTPLGFADYSNPTISAEFIEEGSGIDFSNITIEVIKNDTSNLIFDESYFDIDESGIISNTSELALDKGTYTVTVDNVKDNAGNITSEKQWLFTISGEVVKEDDIPPTATQYPADNATDVSLDVNPYIIFSEEINKSTLISGNVELRQYNDNTEVAATLAINDEGTKVTFIPNTDLGYGTKYYFFIGTGVEDLAGNEFEADTWYADQKDDHEFTTIAEDVPFTSYPIPLEAGWNLISLPLIPDYNDIATVLTGLSGDANINVDVVKYYDVAIEDWVSYKPGFSGDLNTMEDGKGYWIFMNEADILTVNGVEMPGPAETLPTYPLNVGWNLIGFKSVEAMKSSAYLSGVDYITVYGYDDAYSTVAHPASNMDNDMESGSGYWVYANTAGNIVP